MRRAIRTWPLVVTLTLMATASVLAAPGGSGSGAAGGSTRRDATREQNRTRELQLEQSKALQIERSKQLQLERSKALQIERRIESDPPAPGAAPSGKTAPAGGAGGGAGSGAGGGVTVLPPGSMPNSALPARLSQQLVLNLSLRYLLEMRVSDAEIAAALPLLKEMRAAEAALETECEQALEADTRALLAWKPGSPLPTESRDRWRQALARYLAQDAGLWQKLGTATNERTAKNLRALLGRGGAVSVGAVSAYQAPDFKLKAGASSGGVFAAAGSVGGDPPTQKIAPPPRFGNPFALERRLIGPDPLTGLQPRLSLPELIDLLERRQQTTQPSP